MAATVLASRQVPAGGSGTRATFTINFGTIPIHASKFTVIDASVLTTSIIMVTPSGSNGDELELDNFSCGAVCLINGQFDVYISAVPGPVVGSRTFTYNY